MKRMVRTLLVLYTIALLAVWAAICWHSEAFWLLTVFLFAPRWLIAVPLFLLIPWTWKFDPPWMVACAVQAAIILFPILHYELPSLASLNSSQQASTFVHGNLRLLTYNIGEFELEPGQLVQLARENNIEVILLQEASEETAEAVFADLGWNFQCQGFVAIGSSLPLNNFQVLARQPRDTHFDVEAALACDLELTRKSVVVDVRAEIVHVRLICIHLPTFRYALDVVRELDLPRAGPAIRDFGKQFDEISDQILRQAAVQDHPLLLAGDFNVPVQSRYFRKNWGHLQNAFGEVGFGFGYTKSTRFHGIRIDHVLHNERFRSRSAHVGTNLGGDHRPLIVELSY